MEREFIPKGTRPFNIETSSICNLKCRFCAYEKKTTPRVSMSNDLFRSAIEQALAIGFKDFHLTPTTGDVFMDKHLLEKLKWLDEHPGVASYHFFTNLTIPTQSQLLSLMDLKKLSRLTISVYGHDEASFTAITQTSSKIYRRLISNLEVILAHLDHWPFQTAIGFRSTFDVPKGDNSDLMHLLSLLKKRGVGVHASHGFYNNWGGLVSQEDAAGLNIHIAPAAHVFKSGPCVKLFDSVQVMATGIVNACSCRDANATLKIGDLKEKPLAEILTPNNVEYLKIIEEQQQGRFRPICKSCDYYRSIYHQPSDFRRNKTPVQSVREFLKGLEEKAAHAHLARENLLARGCDPQSASRQ
jgi:MoaA/NifB/PqqE/SkfB family radical SAM enzyme